MELAWKRTKLNILTAAFERLNATVFSYVVRGGGMDGERKSKIR